MTKEESLRIIVQNCENELAKAKAELTAYLASAEANCFQSHEEAQDNLTETMCSQAHDDCEGAYNCGDEYYEAEYTLSGSPVVYIARIDVQYNRHDKTYYFVDDYEYSYRVK